MNAATAWLQRGINVTNSACPHWADAVRAEEVLFIKPDYEAENTLTVKFKRAFRTTDYLYGELQFDVPVKVL